MFAKRFMYVCAGLLWVAVGVTIARHTAARTQQPELDSGSIPSGGIYEHTFTAVGLYAYHCLIHPSMQGSVAVVAGGPQSASVSIVNFAFNPSTVSVAPGGAVRWQNDSGVAHTVTSDEPTPTHQDSWGAIKGRYR